MYLPRLRRISDAVNEFKIADPSTIVTYDFLLYLYANKKIKSIKYGNSWLVNLDELYAAFKALPWILPGVRKMSRPFIFKFPLTDGVVQQRKSQFIIKAIRNGNMYSCHCPTTGRVGNLDLSGRPCLLSKSVSENRKTPFTVEAISLNRLEESNKSWIGINQNAVNRYVEHNVRNAGFADIFGTETQVQREKFLGKSKLDFFVGDTYVEVEMPLQHLQIKIPDYVKVKKLRRFLLRDE